MPDSNLSHAEQVCVDHALMGLTNKEIVAARGGGSLSTVEGHLQTAYVKLGVSSRRELFVKLRGKNIKWFQDYIIRRDGGVAHLSEIEKEIIGLLIDGKSNDEMVENERSLSAIKYHFANLYQRVGLSGIGKGSDIKLLVLLCDQQDLAQQYPNAVPKITMQNLPDSLQDRIASELAERAAGRGLKNADTWKPRGWKR